MIARLVEADVPVGTDAEDQQIQAAGVVDLLLIAFALGVEIVGRTIQEVNSRGIDPDSFKQMLVHEAAEAAGMPGADAGELVEIEGAGTREIHACHRAHATKLCIGGDGTSPGGETEDGFWPVAQRLCHAPCEGQRSVVRAVEDF